MNLNLKACDICGQHYAPDDGTGFTLRRDTGQVVYGRRHEWDLCSRTCLTAVATQIQAEQK